MPKENTRVAFAESNAAIFANSVANLQTNKESAFSALASFTGKSPYSESAVNQKPEITLRVKVQDPDEPSSFYRLHTECLDILLVKRAHPHLLPSHVQAVLISSARQSAAGWELRERVVNSF